MLQRFSGAYVGFSKSKRIGEVFEHEDHRWVIIQILDLKLKMYGQPRMEVDIVAQKVGKQVDYSRYYEQHTITDRIKLEGKKPWEFKLKKIGEVITGSDDEKGIKVLAVIIGVESFEYEFVDLIINYRTQMIKPWSQTEIDKVVHENRLSTFKVITGKKETTADELEREEE